MPDIEETFYPTVAFGFSGPKGKERLHRMWIGTAGTLDWRPEPMLDLATGAIRPPSIAGYVPQEEEEDAGG